MSLISEQLFKVLLLGTKIARIQVERLTLSESLNILDV